MSVSGALLPIQRWDALANLIRGIRFSAYRLHLEFDSDFSPYRQGWNSTFRGAIGHELFTRHCLRPASCESGCAMPEKCLYHNIFAEQGAGSTKPYVLSGMELQAQTQADLELLVLDQVEQYAEAIMNALICAGRRGVGRNLKFRISSASKIARQNAETLLADVMALLASEALERRISVEVTAASPLHLTHNGRFVENPGVAILVNSAWRRLVHVAQLCGPLDALREYSIVQDLPDLEIHYDYITPVRQTRFSTRQRRDIHMPGVLFKARIDNLPCWQFLVLLAGGNLHMGRYISWGYGRLNINLVDASQLPCEVVFSCS